MTDARTESFLANLLALEGEIRDAIRKPLGCRSDVAVFLTGVSCNEAGNAGTISPRCSFGVSEYRLRFARSSVEQKTSGISAVV